MNAQIRALIAQHEQKGDFTHVAPTEEMLASAQRLLSVTIPQQFVDYLREYSHGGVGRVKVLGVGRAVGQQLDQAAFNLLVLLAPRVVMLHEEYGKELPQLLQRHVRQHFSHSFTPEQFLASRPHLLRHGWDCGASGCFTLLLAR